MSYRNLQTFRFTDTTLLIALTIGLDADRAYRINVKPSDGTEYPFLTKVAGWQSQIDRR